MLNIWKFCNVVYIQDSYFKNNLMHAYCAGRGEAHITKHLTITRLCLSAGLEVHCATHSSASLSFLKPHSLSKQKVKTYSNK